MDSDDEIELLKQPQSGESETQPLDNAAYQHQASVNPSILLQAQSSLGDSTSAVDPASLHALQTAFTSLHKKHNDLTKKHQELQQRHKLMQSNFSSMEKQGIDPVAASNPAVGAGGSQDEETFTAEIRAKQGYIQHLERELLRCTNSLSKCNDEITRLKKQFHEVDCEKQSWLQDKENLKHDMLILREKLQKSTEETFQKDQKIIYLEERLHVENKENQKKKEELIDLKKHLKNSDREISNIKVRDDKIHELTSRLQKADGERQSMINHCKDLEKRLNDKDREVLALEAQHKQYKIENDINRKQVQAQGQHGSDSMDEVDGENEMIEKAFRMIKDQKKTIQELKAKVDHQKVLISELHKTKVVKPMPDNMKQDPAKLMEEREAAQGASFHIRMDDEKPPSPIYANYDPKMNLPGVISSNISYVTPTQGSTTMPLIRGSGREDYRGVGSRPQVVSPRINDAVKPTGNTNVPRMIASEHSPPLVGIAGSNVIDAQSGLSSPRGRIVVTGVQNNAPEAARQTLRDHSSSPRSVRKSSPVLSFDQLTNSGARPRLRPSEVAQANFEHGTAQISPQISPSRAAERMTQSEIILRDHSGSVQDNKIQPLLDLSRSHENIYAQGQISRSSEDIYLQGQNNGSGYTLPQRNTNQHDYENVYENNGERDSESPNNDFDHSIYVNNPNETMRNRTAVEHSTQQPQQEQQVNSVSALKICPVCNVEFSRLSMDQFQRHVFDCFDNADEPPVTLQPGGNNAQSEDDRTCPMCGASFPLTVQQEVYEQHVLAHFGEEPLIERFEMLN